MKSTSGWQNGSNGTNESGFNAFPGGSQNGSGISYVGILVEWWSSSQSSSRSGKGYDWLQGRFWTLILKGTITPTSTFKTNGLSVRCIKD